MTEKRFDILCRGELLPGFTSSQAGENLSRLFRLEQGQVSRLLAGGSHVLKRNADEATASKYLEALQRAGVRAELRETPKAAGEAGPSRPATAKGSPWSLAAPGSDLLAANERPRVEPVTVETAHLKLASVFAEASATPPPDQDLAPDTSHLSIADPGADLLPERSEPPAPDLPDISAIELAAPGTPLGPGEAQPPMAAPDTSHLSLAAPGTPLEEIRPRTEALDPDTSRIQLAPLDDAAG